MRDDTRRLVADAEQAALALGDDFEPNRGLVERGMPLLELAQSGPFRLADGLARRLDGEVAHRRRPELFLRRTWRGAASVSRAGASDSGDSPLLLVPFVVLRGIPGRPALDRRRGRLLHEPARDEPLPDRPEVRRHPVEDEAGGEVRDDEHEEERHDHEDDPLRLLRGRGHEEPDAIWLAT